ncbi:uncharacterized protein KQ657_003868 [Scheffersomyces spartinae]|uniref:C2H2-type domain-containing protein n=1 Tax=Scheffersomyces spartinae TaxID=45513 RepID=A0A9P7VCS7_9ASCO|nr:uncharacterized protein KQ657_003868 [Scheffersomyces spartinae]KAG7195340.1 hypothetical protein KQ657_003868 [Scheffersomyces spartinae]
MLKASPLMKSKSTDLMESGSGAGSSGSKVGEVDTPDKSIPTNNTNSNIDPITTITPNTTTNTTLNSGNGFSFTKQEQDNVYKQGSRLSISPFLFAQNRQDLLGSILNTFTDTNTAPITAGSASKMDPPRKLFDGNYPYARNSISNYLYYDNGNSRGSIFLPPISQPAGSGNTSGIAGNANGSNPVNSRSNSIFSSLIQIPGSASGSISGASSAVNTAASKSSTSGSTISQQKPLPIHENPNQQQLGTPGQPPIDVSLEDLEYLLNNRESLSGLFSFQSPDRSNSMDGSFWDNIQLPQQQPQSQSNHPHQQAQNQQNPIQQQFNQQQSSNSARPSSGSSLGDILAFLTQGGVDYNGMTEEQRRDLILRIMNDPAIRKSISIAKQMQQGSNNMSGLGGQFNQQQYVPQQQIVLNNPSNQQVPQVAAKLREDIFKSDKLSPGSRMSGRFDAGKSLEQERYSPTSSLSSKSAGGPGAALQQIQHADDSHSPKTSPSGSSGVISGRPSIDLSGNMSTRYFSQAQQQPQSPNSNISRTLNNPYLSNNPYTNQSFGYQQLQLPQHQIQPQHQIAHLMTPLNQQQGQLDHQQLENAMHQTGAQARYGESPNSGTNQSPISTNSETESTKLSNKRQKRSRKKNSNFARTKNASTYSPPLIIGSNTSTDPSLLPAQQIAKLEDGRPLLGATKIDQLMLVIQARDKGVTNSIQQAPDGSILTSVDKLNSILPAPMSLVGRVMKALLKKAQTDENDPKKKKEKTQKCPYCLKNFTHTTHLEVHIRSHIGYKPYECSYCHKKFTQGGNLRTHLRLHTGEKPFKCDICQRSFSRKGNLEAHKLTHEHLKPYECKLDGCDKFFTQLGNLKSHQNKFHLETLTRLTHKLAELSGPALDNLPQSEKDLLMYFKGLYKNSNRGIRGRGKKVTDENGSGNGTNNNGMGNNLSPSFVNPQMPSSVGINQSQGQNQNQNQKQSQSQPVMHSMLAPLLNNAVGTNSVVGGGQPPFQPRIMLPHKQQQQQQQQQQLQQHLQQLQQQSETQTQSNPSQQLPLMLVMMNNMLDNTGIFQN